METQSKLYSIKQTATRLNLPYRAILQSVNDGVIPHYKIGKSRRLLNTQEVISCMKIDGGSDE